MVVADHACLLLQRVVIEDGAQIAPVAVEVVATRGGRCAAGLEQPLGRLQRDATHRELGLRGGERAFEHELARALVLLIRRRIVPQRLCRTIEAPRVVRDQRIDRMRGGREVADHPLREVILRRAVGRAVRGRPRMVAHVVERVGKDVAHDAGGHGHQVELAQRRSMAALQGLGAAVHQLVGLHLEALELQAAARGQALAHAVPVVLHVQAFALGGHDDGDVAALGVAHRDARVVREGGASGVVLAAVEDQAIAIAFERGGHGARLGRAELGEGAAEQRALAHARQLQFAVRIGWRGGPELDRVVVDAQRMRDIGVGRGERRDHLDQVLDRAAGTAALGRHAQRAEARGAEQREGLEGQHAVAFALRGALCNGGCQRGQAIEQGLEVGRQRGAIGCVHR